jgi:predicted DNA-binding transcriptional regulator YafY
MEYDAIVKIEGKKRATYKLIKPIDLFMETFEHTDGIDWFFHLAHEADPEIFKALEGYTNQNKHIYKFIHKPFEDIKELKQKGILKKLETAVKNKEYRKIKFERSKEAIDNLKCLKLLFIDNNWYIATSSDDEDVYLSRVSFIEDVSYASNMRSFQKSSVKKQLNFIQNHIQNSFTRYDLPLKTAVIKTLPQKARYFEKGMKKFFSSQKFKEKLDDGSVIFTIDYTQPLEILPFIQRWIPNLTILEPIELKEVYIKNLNDMLSQ